ncbi:M15 family metallopeptidase [Rheinheimera sp.]|uniref:M15 family metallopeptidase n=1 Tax=Rheinheimera sp. TaxID=1869214 RepID=UPI00307E1AE0
MNQTSGSFQWDTQTVLALQLTGRDERHLQSLDERHRLTAATAQAFLEMRQAAAADGIELALLSSYRSFAQQQRIWQAKYQGHRPVFDKQQQQLDVARLDAEAKIRAILLYSALPGASRHHWGTDFDLYDKAAVPADYQVQLLDAEYNSGGPFYPLHLWLEQHAADFGFFRPYRHDTGGVAQELWHLSYAPEAVPLLNAFELWMLQQAIEQSELADQPLLLALLPELMQRYVKRICQES